MNQTRCHYHHHCHQDTYIFTSLSFSLPIIWNGGLPLQFVGIQSIHACAQLASYIITIARKCRDKGKEKKMRAQRALLVCWEILNEHTTGKPTLFFHPYPHLLYPSSSLSSSFPSPFYPPRKTLTLDRWPPLSNCYTLSSSLFLAASSNYRTSFEY